MKLKKVIVITMLIALGPALAVTVPAQAFLFEIQVLDAGQIKKLPDEELSEKFIDAMVELEAVTTFYGNSAFTPKEYRKYKDLLKYRVLLLQELHRRDLDPPRIQP